MVDPEIVEFYQFCLKEVKKSVERKGGHHWSRIQNSEMYGRLSPRYNNLDDIMHKAEEKLGWYDYTTATMTEVVDHMTEQALKIHRVCEPRCTKEQVLVAIEQKCRTFERRKTEEYLYEKGGNSALRALIEARYELIMNGPL